MAQDPTRLDGLGDAMTGIGFPYRSGYGRPDPGPDIAAAEVFSPCGAAMMIDRSLFLGMGGFDETFFCYCEDVDLGYRLQLMGEPVMLAPRAVVLHEGSASTGGRRSDFSMFHGARNRLWTFVKNTPPLLFWTTLPLHAAATFALWLAACAKGEGRAMGRGVAAGVRGLDRVWRQRKALHAGRAAASVQIGSHLIWNAVVAIGRREPTISGQSSAENSTAIDQRSRR
jgi:GT2 family glycosyltransferase